MRIGTAALAAGALLALIQEAALAGGVPAVDLGEIEVKATRLTGTPQSASQGTVTRQQLEHRSLLRVGRNARSGTRAHRHSAQRQR